MYRRTGLCIGLALLLGTALRLIGLTWGLPFRPDETPYHPDEAAVLNAGATLYTAPNSLTYGWGGALYFRLAYIAMQLAPHLAPDGWSDIEAAIFTMRAVSIAAALATGGLVVWIGVRLYSGFSGGLAALLFMAFPCHVLASHYARPDVLMTLFATAAFACAVKVGLGGHTRFLILGGCMAGLSVAVKATGVLALVPLALTVFERTSDDERQFGSRAAATAGFLTVGGVVGYLLGSFETFMHLEAFAQARARTVSMHAGGSIGIPLHYLTTVSAYAFGTFVLPMAAVGLVSSASEQRPGHRILAGYVLVIFASFAMTGTVMMRFMLIVAPPLAVAAAAGFECIRGPSRERLQWRSALVYGGATLLVLWTIQLSAGYVFSMQRERDVRLQAGDWLRRNLQANESAAYTMSFSGDKTYTPRFDPPLDRTVEPLMLRYNFDSSGYLDREIDYIVTTDFAAYHAKGDTAPAFIEELESSGSYVRVATFAQHNRPLSIPDILGAEPPGDLLYVRPTFEIYRRAADSTATNSIHESRGALPPTR